LNQSDVFCLCLQREINTEKLQAEFEVGILEENSQNLNGGNKSGECLILSEAGNLRVEKLRF
jgi:hypothetical protein